MSELQGRVLKNYNGYYYVSSGESIYTCKVKGRMKQNRFSLVTGDIVNFEVGTSNEGMIKNVLPRRNFLLRPTIANLDLLVVTFSCVTPDFSFLLADKLLALAAIARIPAIIVLNKCDLADENTLKNICEVYRQIGYEVYCISATERQGIAALKARLEGSICAFGGPSGAGKSSTINAIDPGVQLQTGAVSEKIGRGKHTTRFAQLLPFDKGYIADTPGFGNLMLEELDDKMLVNGFREFAAYEESCRFSPCTHTHEPVCGVKQAVQEGNISESRYQSYLDILKEIKTFQEREGKKL